VAYFTPRPVLPPGITRHPQQETGENRVMKSLVICHSQPNIVQVVKSRKVRGWGDEEKRNECGGLVGEGERKRPYGMK